MRYCPSFKERGYCCVAARRALLALALMRASWEARERARPSSSAARTSLSKAPLSLAGAASSVRALSRLMSHKALATMPMLMVGSPDSMRCKVEMLTPMRFDQLANDSLRRSLATAKSAPSFSRAAWVAGGSRSIALGVRDIPVYGCKLQCIVLLHQQISTHGGSSYTTGQFIQILIHEYELCEFILIYQYFGFLYS